MVPLVVDDQNDGTFMIKGEFTGLSIVRNNRTESWGIYGDNVGASWLVSSYRIEVDIGESEEKFSIIHRKSSFISFLEDLLNSFSFLSHLYWK